MPASAGAQLFHGAKPVFVRRSLGTASGSPQLKRERRGLFVPERRDAMSNRACMAIFMTVRPMFQFLP
jgi:hypothetical protein